MASILRLDSANNGDLQEMSTAEENWLSYQAGLQLASMDSDEPGALSTLSSGQKQTVGTYTDTVYDQNVGDHGTLTTTTTITTLHQTLGTVDESGANRRIPIQFIDNSGDFEAHEIDSDELTTVTDRLISRIMTSEYPGTYRLNSSAPSGDYDTHLSNIFTDNRTDGTAVNYSIYQRQTMTAPDEHQPVSVKRSGGKTGTFEGLQEMTTDQIKYTFGQRAKSAIGTRSFGVGSYQLRSSAQGAPTDTGTWSARGTATDTRNTIASQTYTQNFADTFTGAFEGNYEGNYSRDFAGNFVGNYSRDFSADFTRVTQGNFVSVTSTVDSTRDSVFSFIANYFGTRAVAYTAARISTFNFTRDPAYSRNSFRRRKVRYLSNFIGNFVGNFAGNYGNFTRTSTRDDRGFDSCEFFGDFVSTFFGNQVFSRQVTYTRNFLATVPEEFDGGAYTSNFIGNFVRDFSTAFVIDYTGNYVRTRTSSYEGNFSRTRTSTYAGIYSRIRESNFSPGTFEGNFVGDEIQSGSEIIETYTLYCRVA